MDAKKILSELSVDEKIRLLSGVGDWHTFDCNGKAPTIMMTDGPHGLRKVEAEKVGDIEGSIKATCFPTASALASSFDPSVPNRVAKAISREAKKEKVSIVLGCGTNIKRSPFCGRNFEYFSEDPFLAGKMAASYIKGIEEEGVGSSLKHFAVNSQETRRMTSNSEVDERALREIYLPAFEEAVKVGKPRTVMCSYNRINGEFGANNKHLLTEILRDEWGYEGSVVSDWGATNDVVKCFKSGLNLEMPDPQGYHTSELKKAYERKEISDEELDAWALKVLTDFSSLSEKVCDDFHVDMENQNRIAREIEDECAVLLKNEGILPVMKDKRLIVIGDMAKHLRFQGGGSSHINAAFCKSAVEALIDEGYDVVFSKGYESENDEPNEKLVSEALKTVRENYKKGESVVLFFIGLTDSYEGEGYDRTDLTIPFNQEDLLERIEGMVGKDSVAAISFGGAPMDFSFEEKCAAILHMYLGGQAVGEAVADLVSGRVNPSGKLSETMPLVRTDTPAWRYFGNPFDDVEYRESIFVGYRYYETFDVPVRYPFGHGLSYTTFEYSDLEVPEVFEGEDICVTFNVENTGKVSGAEAVQLYVCPEESDVLRSKKELKGFCKVFLNPGEKKRVSISLNRRSFSVFDVEKNAFSVLAGVYKIAVGASIKDIRLCQDIVVEGNRYFRNERKLFPDYFKPQPHGMDIDKNQFEALFGRKLTDYAHRKKGDFDATCSFNDITKKSLFGLIVRGVIFVALRFMFFGKKKNDPSYKMIRMGLLEGNLEGLIATSGGIFSPGLVKALVRCANRKV